MCKRREAFSLAVLIGRGLVLPFDCPFFPSHFLFFYFVQFSGRRERRGNAPLAQLVEHLTLNQGVPGSSP